MLDPLLELILEFVLYLILHFVFKPIFKPIYDYVLFPMFEPICWLMGSIGILVLTLGFIRPSKKKKSNLTGMWGYYEGKQYYFDRELVSGIGLLLWVMFIFILIFLHLIEYLY